MYIAAMQAEAGVGCPISMTYAVDPGAARRSRSSPPSGSRADRSRRTTRELRPAAEKGSALCGMAMTEKQGGSDVRANTTTATPLNGGGPGAEYEITGHKWFCSAPMCDALPVLAQTDEGLSCFLLPAGPARRRAQRASTSSG